MDNKKACLVGIWLVGLVATSFAVVARLAYLKQLGDKPDDAYSDIAIGTTVSAVVLFICMIFWATAVLIHDYKKERI